MRRKENLCSIFITTIISYSNTNGCVITETLQERFICEKAYNAVWAVCERYTKIVL